jgi:menaquinone-9 beta-reductase
MIRCDALVVGGGPAGSTCARHLRLAGWDVVVADRARFPRDKVCAGWLTPEVFGALDLDPAEYRASGRTLVDITAFRTSVIGRRPIETA